MRTHHLPQARHAAVQHVPKPLLGHPPAQVRVPPAHVVVADVDARVVPVPTREVRVDVGLYGFQRRGDEVDDAGDPLCGV